MHTARCGVARVNRAGAPIVAVERGVRAEASCGVAIVQRAPVAVVARDRDTGARAIETLIADRAEVAIVATDIAYRRSNARPVAALIADGANVTIIAVVATLLYMDAGATIAKEDVKPTVVECAGISVVAAPAIGGMTWVLRISLTSGRRIGRGALDIGSHAQRHQRHGHGAFLPCLLGIGGVDHRRGETESHQTQ